MREQWENTSIREAVWWCYWGLANYTGSKFDTRKGFYESLCSLCFFALHNVSFSGRQIFIKANFRAIFGQELLIYTGRATVLRAVKGSWWHDLLIYSEINEIIHEKALNQSHVMQPYRNIGISVIMRFSLVELVITTCKIGIFRELWPLRRHMETFKIAAA